VARELASDLRRQVHRIHARLGLDVEGDPIEREVHACLEDRAHRVARFVLETIDAQQEIGRATLHRDARDVRVGGVKRASDLGRK